MEHRKKMRKLIKRKMKRKNRNFKSMKTNIFSFCKFDFVFLKYFLFFFFNFNFLRENKNREINKRSNKAYGYRSFCIWFTEV